MRWTWGCVTQTCCPISEFCNIGLRWRQMRPRSAMYPSACRERDQGPRSAGELSRKSCDLQTNLQRCRGATRGVQSILDHKGPSRDPRAVRWHTDTKGNLQPLPEVYPDYHAPVVANMEGGRVLTMMRWGMPSPAFALKGKRTDRGVTNIRNTKSPQWRRWFGEAHRCVCPSDSLSEPYRAPGKPSRPVWFALDETRPLAFFAGVCPAWLILELQRSGS